MTCAICYNCSTLTTLRMAADQVTTGGNTSNLGMLVSLLISQGGRFAGLVHSLLVGSEGNAVIYRACVAPLQDDRPVAILGVQGYKVAPDALLNLILLLFGGVRGVRVNKLTERLGILWR